jgi:hypothetical protein
MGRAAAATDRISEELKLIKKNVPASPDSRLAVVTKVPLTRRLGSRSAVAAAS